jgi:hypothetical protein
MQDWLQSLFDIESGFSPGMTTTAGTVVLMILLSFIVGHVIAWTYMWTHAGLSYSQTFTAALLALPVLVALFMVLVSGNVFIALGMLAVFTMIRFRNVLKDTRDTIFVLWCIVEGMAVGTGRFGIALIGAVAVAAVFAYLRATSFGGRHRYDVIVSFEWSGNVGDASVGELRSVLHRHSARVELASQRDLEEDRMDLSYRLLMRDPARTRDLLSDLRATRGIDRATLYHREDESEL